MNSSRSIHSLICSNMLQMLQVILPTAPPLPAPTAVVSPSVGPSIVERTQVVSPAMDDDVNHFHILNNPELVGSARRRFIVSVANREVTDIVRMRINVLHQKLAQRLVNYKQIRLPPADEIQCHWFIMAYEHNLKRFCEILGLNRHINSNIEGTSHSESLLNPIALGSAYIRLSNSDTSDIKHKQGILLYHDTPRSCICHAVTVHGKKATFSKQKPSNELIKAYPKTKPSHSVEGEYRGEFSV